MARKESQSNTTPSDADLVRRTLEGELEAFEELVRRYQRAVFNVACYKCRNYFDAEDLSQEIFLHAFRALPTLREPERFSSWLLGIAYNRCHKWYRRRRTQILKFEELKRRAEEAARERARAERSHDTQSDRTSELLRKLPPEIREVLVLKYLEGLSYEEIQQRLGIKAHRIDYLIRKGKRLLRERAAGREAEA